MPVIDKLIPASVLPVSTTEYAGGGRSDPIIDGESFANPLDNATGMDVANQDLNTFDNVEFVDISSTGTITADYIVADDIGVNISLVFTDADLIMSGTGSIDAQMTGDVIIEGFNSGLRFASVGNGIGTIYAGAGQATNIKLNGVADTFDFNQTALVSLGTLEASLGANDTSTIATTVFNEYGLAIDSGTSINGTVFDTGTIYGDVGTIGVTEFEVDGLLLNDGKMRIIHTSTESDDHALEIDVNADGFGDVKAIDIEYATGTLGASDGDGVILISVDESLATGGELYGIEFLTTNFGTTEKTALKVGVDANVISHDSGAFGNMDSALNIAVNVLAALSSGGAGNISVFVADNDTLTIGDAAQFDEMEILIATPASGAGIAPTFEYSTGVGTWATFAPTDGTAGFKATGSILWNPADLAGWVVGTGGEYLVRITRTRNTLVTTPIITTVQISSATIFSWDKDGDVVVNSVTAVDTMTVVTASVLSGSASTRDDVRTAYPSVAIGSVYLSTAGKIYLKVANGGVTADWERVTTTAVN